MIELLYRVYIIRIFFYCKFFIILMVLLIHGFQHPYPLPSSLILSIGLDRLFDKPLELDIYFLDLPDREGM